MAYQGPGRRWLTVRKIPTLSQLEQVQEVYRDYRKTSRLMSYQVAKINKLTVQIFSIEYFINN